MVDRVRMELIPPIMQQEMMRESALARRVAEASASSTGGNWLALLLGHMLIRAGCRLEAAGQRHAAGMPFAAVSAPCASLRYAGQSS